MGKERANGNPLSISSFFPHKNMLPMLLKSSVVYIFKCADCNTCYIGQTSFQLQLRIHKHIGTSFRTNLPILTPEHSQIRSHTHDSGHPLRFSDFNILHSSTSDTDRKILESLYIKQLNLPLNSSHSSTPLSIT